MTQKEALEQVQGYCKANGMALHVSSVCRGEYELIVAQGDEGQITCCYPYTRISTGHKPKNLLVFIDGYNAGIQAALKQMKRR